MAKGLGGYVGKKRRIVKPEGQLKANFGQLYEAGCIQTGGDSPELDANNAVKKFGRMFALLMVATNNNPCDGCPAFSGGRCKAFLKYHSASPENRPVSVYTYPQAVRKRCATCGKRVRGKSHDCKNGQ